MSRLIRITLPLVALFLIFGITDLTAQKNQLLQPVDIFDLEYVSNPTISPDGNRVLYVRNFKDIMTDRNLSNLWMVNFDGSQNIPLTTGNQKDHSPYWSGDGKRIIFISNKDGSNQVYLKWLDGGYEAKLTNFKEVPKNLIWSPDGQWIAFTMFVEENGDTLTKLKGKPKGAVWNKPATFIEEMSYRSDGTSGFVKAGSDQLFIISVDGGTARQLTFAQNDVRTAEWSRDGSSLYFHANLEDDADYNPRNSEIYGLELTTGTIKRLTNRQGPDANPKISPDGETIAYTGYDDRYQGYQVTRLYTMDTNGQNIKELAPEFDRDISNIHWSDDGRGIYFSYQDQGDNKIAHVDLSGKIRELTSQVGGLNLGRPYTSGAYSVTGKGKLAFTMGGTQQPPDLAVSNNGSQAKRLTHLNDDLFSFKASGKVEEIWFKSGYDQRDIQGWICYPPNFDSSKKYPMILEIHGGPFLAYGPWFSMEIQLFAAAGYVVLYTNPRGSTSYGQEFGNLIHHNYPGQDYDDLMSGVDAVIEKGFIDSDQLFVTGGSGGGVLTAWIVGNTDRFRAAVVAKPVINWYSFVLYSDGTSYHKYWFSGVPWENQEHYMKRSPISLVGNVTTPTLLLTGESDFRTPMAETEQYYRALKLQKVETGMVRIPGASHGIASRPSNLMAKVAHILAWFERYKEK